MVSRCGQIFNHASDHGQRKVNELRIKPIQLSGPIHHPWCQPTFLELCPEMGSSQVGCQIPRMEAAGCFLLSPCRGDGWLRRAVHTKRDAYPPWGRTLPGSTARWQQRICSPFPLRHGPFPCCLLSSPPPHTALARYQAVLGAITDIYTWDAHKCYTVGALILSIFSGGI